MSDIVDAARTYLADQRDVREALGFGEQWDTWLFKERLYVQVPGSSACAVVLTLEGNWATMNEYNTLRFPRLGVTIYADPERDEQGSVIDPDSTRPMIMDVFDVLNGHLHRVSGESQMWGAVRVISSKCLNEPFPRPFIDGDQAASAQVFYALQVG